MFHFTKIGSVDKKQPEAKELLINDGPELFSQNRSPEIGSNIESVTRKI